MRAFSFSKMSHYVYIIFSEKYDVYYKGESVDPIARLEMHNSDLSEYTKLKGPWKLVYYSEFPDRTTALRREKQLKNSIGGQLRN